MKTVFGVLFVMICMLVAGNSEAQWRKYAGWSGTSNTPVMAASDTDFFLGLGAHNYVLSENDTAFKQICDFSITPQFEGTFTYKATQLIASGDSLLAASTGGVFEARVVNGIWTSSSIGFSFTNITGIAIIGGDIIISVQGQVYDSTENLITISRSTDNGRNWVTMNSTLKANCLLGFSGKLFAGTSNGLFVSEDEGKTWVPIGVNYLKGAVTSLSSSGGYLFVTTFDSDPMHYGGTIYVSKDIGQTWSPLSNEGLGGSASALAANDSTIFAATTQGVWYYPVSKIVLTPALKAIPTSISFSADVGSEEVDTLKITNTSLVPLIVDSVYTTTKWFSVPATNGVVNQADTLRVPVTFLPSAGISYSDRIVIVSNAETLPSVIGLYGTGISSPTDNWVRTASSSMLVTAICSTDTSLFAATSDGLFLSTDKGVNWSFRGQGPLNRPPYILSSLHDKIFAGTEDGVFESSDSGKTWTAFNTGLPSASGLSVGPRILGLASGSERLYAATGGGIFCSTNDSADWHSVLAATVDSASLVASGEDVGYSRSNSYYSSKDDGATWISSSMITWPGYSLTIQIFGNYIFVGSNYGVFLSLDGGNKWNDTGLADDNLTSVSVLAVSGSYLYAGTNDGIWRRPLSAMITSLSNSPNQIPTTFSLFQNYPNPFNPTTSITYDISERSHVTLTVYDVLGRRVTTLVNAEKSPGEYHATFNGTDFSSGVYFYRLQAGNCTATKKLMLMK